MFWVTSALHKHFRDGQREGERQSVCSGPAPCGQIVPHQSAHRYRVHLQQLQTNCWLQARGPSMRSPARCVPQVNLCTSLARPGPRLKRPAAAPYRIQTVERAVAGSRPVSVELWVRFICKMLCSADSRSSDVGAKKHSHFMIFVIHNLLHASLCQYIQLYSCLDSECRAGLQQRREGPPILPCIAARHPW